MEPRLEMSKSGTRTLIVYYHGDGFEEAIRQAEERFNVVNDSTVTVICLPVGLCNDFKYMGAG